MVKLFKRNKPKKKQNADRLFSPEQEFHSDFYLRHNARRLEHLASLDLPVTNLSVLEVGAGIGDHSHFYIDRGCKITITEAREENLVYLRKRYPNIDVQCLDLESPSGLSGAPFDITHCYGLLYHLSKPEEALSFLAQQTGSMLFLETCVSFGDGDKINLIDEPQSNPTQAFSGVGCRPTRSWVFNQLKRHFEYVYMPLTQPCHPEFPINWSAPEQHSSPLQRSVFIASRNHIENPHLTASIPMLQSR